MALDFSELKKKIIEKNHIIDSLSSKPHTRNEEVEKAKKELDKLLYIYYKSIGSGKGSVLYWGVF
jgi:hypothetical protein